MTRAMVRSLIGSVGLAALLWMLFTTFRPDPQDGSTTSPGQFAPQDEADLQLGRATITEFDKAGGLKYRLYAAKMSRFEATAQTALIEPRLLLHADDGVPWNVESKRGTILEAPGEEGGEDGVEDVVQLRDDVVLRQLDGSSGLTVLTIRSPAIDLFPSRQFANSTSGVMIDSDVGRTQAASMRGDLNTGQLHLAAAADQPVHSIVLPTQFKSDK